MPKFGFFWYSKIDIFACTIRKGWPCFDWYLEASKTENDRVTCSQKINKKLLETIRTKKGCQHWHTDTCDCQVTGLVELGSHVWHWCHLVFAFGGTLATWLLISGHLFAFCFIWSVTPGWWSSGSVWFECTDIWLQTVRANMWIAHSKLPHPTWEPLGKIF